MISIWFYTIFGFRPYHRLRQASLWHTALFVVYLILMGVLIFNLYFAWQMHRQLPIFVKNFPTLTFEKGKLTAPEKPISLSIPNTNYELIFDATAKNPPTQQDFLNKKIMAFITEDRFYMPSVTGISSQPIPSQIDGVFDSQRLQSYASTIRNFLQSVVFVGAFFIMGMFLLFSILLAAAIVFFWNSLMRAKLPIGVIWRWAIFLQGPALVLWTIHLIWGVPLFPFALFILFNIYIQQIFNTLPEK